MEDKDVWDTFYLLAFNGIKVKLKEVKMQK